MHTLNAALYYLLLFMKKKLVDLNKWLHVINVNVNKEIKNLLHVSTQPDQWKVNQPSINSKVKNLWD